MTPYLTITEFVVEKFWKENPEICTNGWIPTFTGKTFNFVDPQPDQIDIVDIAVGLARCSRFAGQGKWNYTVAQHSYFGSFEVPPKLALEFLLHDAPEAYTGDVVRPFKRMLGPYLSLIEHRIHLAIAERFGIPRAMSPQVKLVDERMLATERRDVMKPHAKPWHLDERSIEPYPFYIPEQKFSTTLGHFCHRFEELTGQVIDLGALPHS